MERKSTTKKASPANEPRVESVSGTERTACTKEEQNTTTYIPLKVHWGDIDFLLYSDGYLRINTPHPVLAPTIPLVDFETQSEALHLRKDIVHLSINVMLLKTSDKTILIDAGLGKHFGGNQEGQLLENLAHSGISADSITDILISHAHRDHIGGLVSTDGTIVYPHAKYHISDEEYRFWMNEHPDFSRSKQNPEQIKGAISFTQNILNKIKKNIVLFTPGDTLFSFIQTESAPGHTPGQTLFTITSGNRSLKNIADVFHTPIMITKPEWGAAFDIDFEQSIQTRKRILEDCFVNKTLVMSTHLPWPGLGYIDKKDTYFWSPLPYYTPYEINL